MRNKTERFTAIREIIGSKSVHSQEELLGLLLERGFAVTQATLSRDLKQMKVAKAPDVSGQYVYHLPTEVQVSDGKSAFFTPGANATVIFSGNIVVLHTRPGYASSIAFEIDQHANDVIIGTVAGDDTVFCVIGESISRDEVLNSLSAFIPSLEVL